MKNFFQLIAFGTLVVVATSCERKAEHVPNSSIIVTAEKLATVPAGYDSRDVWFDPAGHQVATLDKRNGRMAVRLNQDSGDFYDEVRSTVFPKEVKGVAYIAKAAGKECVVMNSKAGKRYDAIDKLAVIPGGKAVYTAREGDKWSLVAGERTLAVTDGFATAPVMSADGTQLAIAAVENQNKKYLLVCSAKLDQCIQGSRYDAIGELRTGKSTSRVAYIATKGGKKSVVTAEAGQSPVEREGTWYDDVTAFDISDNGKHVAFLAQRGKDSLLVADGAEVPAGRIDTPLDVAVANSGRVMHVVMVQGKVLAFHDGKRVGGEYSTVEGVTFSDDGVNYAFSAAKGEKFALVVNGVEGPWLDMVVTPRFTSGGNLVVYRARNNGERYVVTADLQARTVREHPHYEGVWEVVLFPDGKSIGYGAKQGNDLWWKVEPVE